MFSKVAFWEANPKGNARQWAELSKKYVKVLGNMAHASQNRGT